MRINKYVAAATGLSRRAADAAVADNRILVNGSTPQTGQDITGSDTVTLDGHAITPAVKTLTIMLNKPVGYVCSRDGQGSKTVYDLLPPELHHLKPVGRLDKDSSGLLLLTNDGQLAYKLTHPSKQKQKVYQVTLDKPLQPQHRQLISGQGVPLEDGLSHLQLQPQTESNGTMWTVRMSEGRNRQIRRTFAHLGYTVIRLHRTHFGSHTLPGTLQPGQYTDAS